MTSQVKFPYSLLLWSKPHLNSCARLNSSCTNRMIELEQYKWDEDNQHEGKLRLICLNKKFTFIGFRARNWQSPFSMESERKLITFTDSELHWSPPLLLSKLHWSPPLLLSKFSIHTTWQDSMTDDSKAGFLRSVTWHLLYIHSVKNPSCKVCPSLPLPASLRSLHLVLPCPRRWFGKAEWPHYVVMPFVYQ